MKPAVIIALFIAIFGVLAYLIYRSYEIHKLIDNACSGKSSERLDV